MKIILQFLLFLISINLVNAQENCDATIDAIRIGNIRQGIKICLSILNSDL